MKSQKIFQLVLVILSFLSLPLCKVIIDYTSHCKTSEQSCLEYTDIFTSLLFAFGFICTRYAFVYIGCFIVILLTNKKEHVEDIYEAKTRRFAHHAYQCIYYSIISCIAFSLLQSKPFYPRELGGVGKYIPFVGSEIYEFSQSLYQQLDAFTLAFIKRYFLSSAGYHLSSLYFLTCHSKFQETNFWETIARVILVFELILFAYVGRHFALGAIILIIHDATDAITYACKALVDTSCKMTTFVTAVILMAAWAYARLFCLAKLIIIPLIREIEEGLLNNLEPAVLVILLLCLYFMNLYWFLLMTRSCWAFVNSGRVKDFHIDKAERKKNGLVHKHQQ